MSQDTRARLARDAGYQGDQAEAFASILVGETDEELTAHAAAVAELFSDLAKDAPPEYQPATDPSQGRGGATRPDEGLAFARRLRDHLLYGPKDYDPWRLTMGTHRPGT